MNGTHDGEALSFSRTSRSYNSLPRHLPSSYSVPYGYKIDLDFVRFCDNYYDNRDSQRPANRLRRTKKSHKKSYNSLLGLHKEKSDRPKTVSPPVQSSDAVRRWQLGYRAALLVSSTSRCLAGAVKLRQLAAYQVGRLAWDPARSDV